MTLEENFRMQPFLYPQDITEHLLAKLWYFTNLDFLKIARDFPSKNLPFRGPGRVKSRPNLTRGPIHSSSLRRSQKYLWFFLDVKSSKTLQKHHGVLLSNNPLAERLSTPDVKVGQPRSGMEKNQLFNRDLHPYGTKLNKILLMVQKSHSQPPFGWW